MEGRYFEDVRKFEQLIESHLRSGKVFKDADFPASQSSIIDPNDDVDDLQDLGPVTWKRITDIQSLRDTNQQLNIFFGGIEPNDIQQG